MKVGVFGRGKFEKKEITKKAKEIGKIIAYSGHTVVTGGTNGYPHIVALSAIQVGGKAVSYATGRSITDHSQFHNVDISKYTKIIFQKKYFNKKLSGIDNYLRSLYMCLDIDIAIVIGGKVGTMFEVTLMSGMSKDIYVLQNSGGITDHTIRNFIKEGHKENSKIIFFENLEKLRKLLKK